MVEDVFEFLGVSIRTGKDGRWYVKGESLYPAMIAYIQQAIKEQVFPPELEDLKSPTPRNRGKSLILNAEKITADGWRDALRHRQEFPALPYNLPEAMVVFLSPEAKLQLVQIQMRAQALETCLGWFQIALRHKYGSFNLVITTEEDEKERQAGEEKNPHYRL